MTENKLLKPPKVDEDLLNEIVSRVVPAIHPLKIILFGSWAYGKPEKDSDLDILVIVDHLATTRREMRVKIRGILRSLLLSKDIVVASSKDIEEWKNVPQAFISTILKKGRVIYERED